MARKTKAESAMVEEDAEVEGEPRERWGASIRVMCANERCVNYREAQIARFQRLGDIYYVPYLHCAKCLFQMYVINPAIAGPLGMSMDEEDE